MLTSEYPDPSYVLQSSSTPPSVLCSAPLPSLAHAEQTQERDAAIDLRIGLLWLGAEGRQLLEEYINTHEKENHP